MKISNLNFKYGKKIVLENISCTFEKGNVYGIIDAMMDDDRPD